MGLEETVAGGPAVERNGIDSWQKWAGTGKGLIEREAKQMNEVQGRLARDDLTEWLLVQSG